MADPQSQMRSIDQLLIKAAGSIRDADNMHVRSAFGYDYANALTDNAGYRATLYPSPGETYDQWVSRVDKELPGFSSLVGNKYETNGIQDQQGSQRTRIQQLLNRGKSWDDKDFAGFSEEEIKRLRESGGFADPNNLGEAEKFGGEQRPGGPSGTDSMREFARHLMGPLDENDPYVKSVINASAGAASRAAASRGVHGGLATSNVVQGVANATNAAQMQRQQLGLSALQSAEGLDMQQAQMAQQAYAQQYAAQMGQLQNSYQANKSQSQGMWGTLGGIGGAVVGGYFGGPAGAQAGLTAGSQLGAGIAGSQYGAPPTMSYNPPGLGYRSRGGGGGGNY